ncbi:MAG TPA: hypothetical protein VIZ65_14535 [Cellvibrionaceae bacterium]
MKLVSASLVNVKRARREMEKSFEAGDWDGVKRWDALVGKGLDTAFDDPNRDNAGLVDELEKVLGLYAQIVIGLPEQTAEKWLNAPVSADIKREFK